MVYTYINKLVILLCNKFVRRATTLLMMFGLCLYQSPLGNKSTCGTSITKAQILYELNLIAAGHRDLNTLDKPIRLAVHIHWISNGQSDSISKNLIYQNIEGLNSYFNAIHLGFDIVGFHEHINPELTQYATAADKEALEALLIPRTINIFYTDKISIQGSDEYCGFTYYPTAGKDYILLKKDCSIYNSTAIHEMGHFLGLYHTHESSFGKDEDGSKNCNQAGDLICDTPVETMANMLPNSKTVHLPVNFMSYGDKSQRSFFSNGQYNKMTEVYCAFKSHLEQTTGAQLLFTDHIYEGNITKISCPHAKYVEWPDGSCMKEKMLKLKKDTVIELTIGTSSHTIHKQIKISVSKETDFDGNTIAMKGESTDIAISSSNPKVAYTLYANNKAYGYAHYGNGGILKIKTWRLYKKTIFKVLVSQPGTQPYFLEKSLIVNVL